MLVVDHHSVQVGPWFRSAKLGLQLNVALDSLAISERYPGFFEVWSPGRL